MGIVVFRDYMGLHDKMLRAWHGGEKSKEETSVGGGASRETQLRKELHLELKRLYQGQASRESQEAGNPSATEEAAPAHFLAPGPRSPEAKEHAFP